MNSVRVNQRLIGPGQPIFIIAEIGLNHNQNLDMALALIEVAAESGCSAAKFQTFNASDVYVNDARTGNYILMGKTIPIYSLHQSLEMPRDWIPILAKRCEELEIEFFSAPIGKRALDSLTTQGVNLLKISSYECTNLPFLLEVAKKQIPTVLSTGACSLSEVEAAIEVFDRNECPVILLHCVTQYPAEFQSANLAVMNTLRSAFQVPVGFSNNGFRNPEGDIDYLEVPKEVAKSGADAFEIHITLDRNLPGPDHGFATEPLELKKLVSEMNCIRELLNNGHELPLNSALQGDPRKKTLPEEEYVRNFAFKCLFAKKEILPGEKLTTENTAVLRPGEGKRGIEPKYFNLVVNLARARRLIGENDPISWESIL